MPELCFGRCDGHHEMVDWLKRGLTPKIVAVQLDQVEAVKEMLSSWWRSRFGAR